MRNTPPSPALLWDESHLWGILLLRALHALDVPVTVVSAEQVRSGILSATDPGMLLVPGGWAKLKSLALGEDGREAIREYVRGGGVYLGFCGGAGLGLASEPGIPLLDLCSWSRKPATQRLPNFSGHMNCMVGLDGPLHQERLPVWWPSQFAPDPEAPLEILARYESPGPDFWSADLDWSAVAPTEVGRWEEFYGINLDPGLLRGDPCIVRGRYGRGSFILSYPHLETPNSPQANSLLAHLLGRSRSATVPEWNLDFEAPVWDDPTLGRMHSSLAELIRFGQNHFLLFWRTPWLLGWRRGVPGSPLTFLATMVWQARHSPASEQARAFWATQGAHCMRACQDFCGQAKTYLLLERRILASSPSSPEASASPELQRRKVELFGKFPGYGGLYGEILGSLDRLVWLQITPQGGGTDRP